MTDQTAAPSNVIAGRYQLERRLARGGMAEVFLAQDLVLRRPVAVKVLHSQNAADPTFVARFQREAKAAAKLNHPNIVAVYDTGREGDTYFIAMEYVPGRTLAELVADEGALSIDDANSIAGEVANALAFAHDMGVIHRDIKPSNIMINPDGQAKVTDFGIARAVSGDSDLTDTGKVMGTATYFSPEQAQGFPIDPRSDLYALGVVLFEMVTGGPPFTGPSPVTIAYKHVQEPPPLASGRTPDLPPDLDVIIDTLLAKNPGSRYEDATALVADLDRLWHGQPVVGAGGRRVAEQNGAEDDATAALNPVPMRHQPGPVPPDGPGGPTAAMTAPLSQDRPVRRGPPASAGYAQQAPSSRSGLYVGVVVVLVLLLIGVVVVLAQQLDTSTEPAAGDLVTVPAVIGISQAAATNRLTDAGLVADVRFEANDEVDPGTVFDQQPDARTEVEAQSMVRIMVATTDDTVEVPALVDQTADAARAELVALGFEVTVTEQPSDVVAAGRVVSQSIPAGEAANRGALVALIISSGPDIRAVPSVVDLQQGEAERILSDAGFVVRTEEVDAGVDPADAGRVVSQTPSADQELPVGSVVVIRVTRTADTTTTASTTTTSAPTTTTTTTTSTSTSASTTTASTTTTTTTTTESTTTTTDPTSTSEGEG